MFLKRVFVSNLSDLTIKINSDNNAKSSVFLFSLDFLSDTSYKGLSFKKSVITYNKRIVLLYYTYTLFDINYKFYAVYVVG